MSCPSNKKWVRFLFWKWQTELPHDNIIVGISKFMSSSYDFHVHVKCIKCGVTREHSFIEPEELLRKGITIQELDNVDSRSIYRIEQKNIKW